MPIERLKKEVSEFQKELKKHLSEFVTAAFSFVAAFLWRDAIQSSLDKLTAAIPAFDPILAKYYTAAIITFVAVISIVVISRLLKVEEETK